MLNNITVPFENLPQFDLFDGGKMNLLTNVKEDTANALFDSFKEQGYVLYDAHEDCKNRFATFTKDNMAVHISYFAPNGMLRIVNEKPKALPPVKAEGRKAVTTPLVTQIRATNFSIDCGMNYLIRMADGRFVVIDGGYGEYDESEHMYALLQEQNVLDTPTIAVWFFSHPHDDHILGFLDFCKKYENEFVLERVCYNWAELTLAPASCKHDHFDAYIDTIAHKIDVIIGHSGQRFVFDGCTFDVLYACEDAYPEAIRNYNDTSMVLRMSLNGHRVLWLGDAQQQASERICQSFPEEALRCEIVQVGHHGYGGGSDALYRTTDPKLLLWPCPDFWFPVVRLWGANKYLITTPHLVENTYVSGQAETIWDFSKEKVQPIYIEDFQTDSYLYNADFAKKSVTALKWSCLTGGGSGYAPLTIDFIDDGCHLTCRPGATSVCCLVQTYDLKGNDSYVLRLRGKQVAGDIPAGLLWNYEKPITWNEERVLPIVSNNGAIDFTLTVNAAEKTATLERGEEKVVLSYEQDQTNGLHLVMRKGAEVELYEVSAKKL